ncbi:MAG: ParA family protein [Gammaproteobacteria bacterium]|nr:ParA family protein [Gammaproteobacteria bacterium]
MYVTTFYSFKGGVGRTMALANVAVTLANSGRHVLVVDFDLEAPGLDTFDVLKPSREVPGVIDFVAQYLETGQSPVASNFVAECPTIGNQGGSLKIMRSGSKESYTASFSQINWIELYDKHDGFLLFEDLKEQLKKTLNPDYVLIDSRTGHTDTSGICTRQLPDAVVVFFFPNEQNLRGLVNVVEDIRSEAEGVRNKNIELHFVMSNVPDLDDEDQILDNKIKAFQEQLGFQQEPMIVHRYDSLSLLNQVVFCKDRPKSRLSSEYRKIAREISVRNWNDRDGSLEYIRRAERSWRKVDHESILGQQEMLDKIQNGHPKDGEVLFRLGEFKESQLDLESALSLIDQAIDEGFEEPEAFLKRSRIRERLHDYDGKGLALDVWRVLNCPDIPPPMVREAVSRLIRMNMLDRKKVIKSSAVSSLSLEAKSWLADMLEHTNDGLYLAVDLLEQILHTGDLSEKRRETTRHKLGLLYMGFGRCAKAADMFRDGEKSIDELGIAEVFNLAMARWGICEEVELELFHKVVELDLSDLNKYPNPNYNQCMAIAHWAIGENNSARKYLTQTDQGIKSFRGRTEFSCWRYRKVGLQDFSNDLDEIKKLIEGNDSIVPKFISLIKNPVSDTQ